MREVDLLLLEEVMMRRNFETSKTALTVQASCMTIIAIFLFGAFFYALTHPASVEVAASKQPSHTEIGSLPGYLNMPHP